MQGFQCWGGRDFISDFYLLWQGGLRPGEVEELRLEDPDTSPLLSAGLARRRLTILHSKGLRDRTAYLTDTAVQVLEAYLAVRGMEPTDHVFLPRGG